MTKPAAMPIVAPRRPASRWIAPAIAAVWLALALGRLWAEDDVVVPDDAAAKAAGGRVSAIIAPAVNAQGPVRVVNARPNVLVIAPNAIGVVVAQNAANNNPAVIDQWFFPRGQTADRRAAFQVTLSLQLAELDRCSHLSEAQNQKMALAMQHDMARFFEAIEELRLRLAEDAAIDKRNLKLELAPMLAKSQTGGLCGPDSFFQKTLPRVLGDEQLMQYRQVVDQRHRRRYLATIDVALQELEQRCPLDSRQHETIRRLLADKPCPAMLPDTRTIVALVMYRLSEVPAERLQPLFADHHWETFNQYRLGFQVNRQRLVQIGLLDNE